MKKIFFLAFTCCIQFYSYAQQDTARQPISTAPFSSSTGHWYGIYDKSNIIFPKKDQPRYKPSQITEIADNILLYQRSNGGWPKNYDMQAILTEAQKDSLIKTKDILHTTFDNSTTFTHIEYLSKVYEATKTDKYKDAALRGLNYILEAQYDNGGWPQYYPLEKGDYSTHITFNDGAYIGIMDLLEDIVNHKSYYSYVPADLYDKIKVSYDKGLDCILKCQISDHNVLNAWAQQYDEITLKPAWARAFEPPSICSQESVGVVKYLMSLDNPGPRVIKAVQSAVKWFDDSKIPDTRIKIISTPVEQSRWRPVTTDKIVVEDTTAPPIWTRYYELETHRQLFCDRNSKFLYKLSDVSHERRAGYQWYGYEPQEVLNMYPEWQKKWAPNENVLKK